MHAQRYRKIEISDQRGLYERFSPRRIDMRTHCTNWTPITLRIDTDASTEAHFTAIAEGDTKHNQGKDGDAVPLVCGISLWLRAKKPNTRKPISNCSPRKQLTTDCLISIKRPKLCFINPDEPNPKINLTGKPKPVPAREDATILSHAHVQR
jgi:hypothetical protein